jgi:hypothetical protein
MDFRRRTMQDVGLVIDWFKGFEAIKQEHSIKSHNMYNFDETGFRVACPSGVDVYVPEQIDEVRPYISNYLI